MVHKRNTLAIIPTAVTLSINPVFSVSPSERNAMCMIFCWNIISLLYIVPQSLVVLPISKKSFEQPLEVSIFSVSIDILNQSVVWVVKVQEHWTFGKYVPLLWPGYIIIFDCFGRRILLSPQAVMKLYLNILKAIRKANAYEHNEWIVNSQWKLLFLMI